MSGNPYLPPTAAVADIEPGAPSLERPPLVTLGVSLLWANIGIGITELVFNSFYVLRNPENVELPTYLLGATYSLGVSILMIVVTLYARKGRNWARLVHLFLVLFSVLAVLVTYFALRSVMAQMGGEAPEFIGRWQILRTALYAAGVTLLFTPRANQWYRAIKATS